MVEHTAPGTTSRATSREASRASSRPPQPHRSPPLPSVKAEPGFLCGLEFDSLPTELAFFAAVHAACASTRLRVDIHLQPGELLLFDNRPSHTADAEPANPESYASVSTATSFQPADRDEAARPRADSVQGPCSALGRCRRCAL